MTDTTTLDEAALVEIEARHETAEGKYLAITEGKAWHREVSTPTLVIGESLADVPVLIATIRSLRTENRELKAIVDVGTSDDPGAAVSKLRRFTKDAVDDFLARVVAAIEAKREEFAPLGPTAHALNELAKQIGEMKP